jgi:hypothetical protein
MSKPDTLANLLLRETFRPHASALALSLRPVADLRAALIRARRFVLDESMSAFMAGAHQVRGHWRLYQRGPGLLCPDRAHEWGAADARGQAHCARCSAWRTWIGEHQRGDATLGFVIHDYAVTHQGGKECPGPEDMS